MPLISYEELNRLLVPNGSLNSPSELHGMLCGRLAGGQRLKATDWLQEAMDFLDVIPAEGPGSSSEDEMKMRTAVTTLYSVVLAQMKDSDFGMQLLLPTDEAELALRTESLGEWCHGFLSGFGVAGLDPNAEFSTEAADALRDLAAIVSIGDGADEDSEDAEASLFEICEYVRMAVLTLFMEFGQASQQGATEILH